MERGWQPWERRARLLGVQGRIRHSEEREDDDSKYPTRLRQSIESHASDKIDSRRYLARRQGERPAGVNPSVIANAEGPTEPIPRD